MKDIELVEVQAKYADDIWEFDAKRQRGKHEVFLCLV